MYCGSTSSPWFSLLLLLSSVAPLSGQEAESPLRILKGHSGSVMSVAFSPDGEMLASGSRDDAIKLWDVLTRKLLRTLTGHGADVYSIAFSPDGKVLASGSADKSVRLWEVQTGVLRGTLMGHDGIVRWVTFSPDGKMLASGSEDKTLRLWDAARGKLLRTLPGHALKSLAFSPDGKTMVSGGRDTTVQLWDVTTGKRRALLEGHSGCIEGVAFSPDGNMVASSSEDGTVRLWDVAKATLRQTLRGHGMEVDSVVFSPDGKVIASGGKDRSIKLWDTQTGELRRTLTGPLARQESLAFSPDGATLASGSGGPEALIRLWSLRERVQRFDTDPRWDGLHHRADEPKPRTIRQDFGYSKPRHAGGEVGEIGGWISPAAEPAYYAKKISEQTFAETLTASGTLATSGRGVHALIGFFNADTVNEWRTPNTVALRISGRGDVFYAWVEYATSRWRAGGDEPKGFPTRLDPKTKRRVQVGFTGRGTIHRWSLHYDPKANEGGGVITATIDDQTAVCHLHKGHKADGAVFNRFGLLNVMKSGDEGSELWLGDVTLNGRKEVLRTDPGYDGEQGVNTHRVGEGEPDRFVCPQCGFQRLFLCVGFSYSEPEELGAEWPGRAEDFFGGFHVAGQCVRCGSVIEIGSFECA